MDSVKALCERSLLLKNGSVEMDGLTEDVIDSYIQNQEVYSELENALMKISEFGILFEDHGSLVRSGTVPFGTDFMIEFRVQLKDFKADDKIYFAVSLRSKRGQKVTTFDNLYSEQPIFVKEKDSFVVRCLVKSNFLVPGEYFLELYSGTFFETYLFSKPI
jgi:hypothetical protein